MLIDFKQIQLAQFESVIERLKGSPQQYLDFIWTLLRLRIFIRPLGWVIYPAVQVGRLQDWMMGPSILIFAWPVLSAWFLFILQMILSYRMAHIEI